MRPFKTPLFEVCAEIDTVYRPVVDFPGWSFYRRFQPRFPILDQLPLLIVPLKDATPQQIDATPPIYRFSTEDRTQIIHLGPRMVTANVHGWPGYPQFRSFAEEVFTHYFSVAPEAIVERFSLGFYNRIPIKDSTELQELLAVPFNMPDETQPFETVAQWSRGTRAGSVLTQLTMMQADAETHEQFLAVNNIIRAYNTIDGAMRAEQYLVWMDEAHEIARDLLWNMLTDDARANWQEQHDRAD